MAAIANMAKAMTLRPSMRSRCASMKARPASRRMIAAAAAEPAMIRNSRRPKASGAITTLPRKRCVNRLGGQRHRGKADDQARQRERGVEPHHGGERRRRHQAGRRHLQHQHVIEPWRAGAEAETPEQQPKQHRQHQQNPDIGRQDQTGPCPMAAQLGRVDAQKRQHDHHHDHLAEIGLAGGGERRDGEADEDRACRDQGAVAAEQRQRGGGQSERSHS